MNDGAKGQPVTSWALRIPRFATIQRFFSPGIGRASIAYTAR